MQAQRTRSPLAALCPSGSGGLTPNPPREAAATRVGHPKDKALFVFETALQPTRRFIVSKIKWRRAVMVYFSPGADEGWNFNQFPSLSALRSEVFGYISRTMFSSHHSLFRGSRLGFFSLLNYMSYSCRTSQTPARRGVRLFTCFRDFFAKKQRNPSFNPQT